MDRLKKTMLIRFRFVGQDIFFHINVIKATKKVGIGTTCGLDYLLCACKNYIEIKDMLKEYHNAVRTINKLKERFKI